MNLPKISVIVPVYNVENYLDRCINSLLYQTLKEIEIIMIDDKSTDSSSKICDSYINDNYGVFPAIKVVHKIQNEGLGYACNSGIEIASGEYIAFCDSDDWVELNTYETLYNLAISNSADIVFSGIQTIDDNGNVHPMNQPNKFDVIREKSKILEYAIDMIASEPSCKIERKNAMSAKIALYRRKLIEDYHLKFESEREFMCEDLIWNIDIIGCANCIVTIPQTFYYYYNNPSSLSKVVRTDRFDVFKKFHTELIQRTKKIGYPENVKERIDRMFLAEIRHYIRVLVTSSLDKDTKKHIVIEMLNDSKTTTILSSYPIRNGSFIHYITYLLMKWKCYYILKILFNLENK